MSKTQETNPFRPGAGQMPPYLAGRESETEEFKRLLQQERILENLVLTGLRGVGKTVLLETFKPKAMEAGWLWAGADLSESTSVSEEIIALRIIADLAVVTSGLVVGELEIPGMGYKPQHTTIKTTLNFDVLQARFRDTPGLVADKLKSVLEFVWTALQGRDVRGLVFAYDEAQNMSDRPAKEQYPLALLLDVFQSIQRKGIPFMLALTGLPTLFPKLVEARTFAERMFHVLFLDRLDKSASRDAILKPLRGTNIPFEPKVNVIIEASGGYPYFIQFICREGFDVLLRQLKAEEEIFVPIDEIIRKLDADFFAGRWSRATDRQRDLLSVVARLANCDEEFTVQEIVELSREILKKPFSASHVNQMLAALSNAGLIYKNRHGKYSFAVPLFGQFIVRQSS